MLLPIRLSNQDPCELDLFEKGDARKIELKGNINSGKIYLSRHGQSLDNVSGTIGGNSVLSHIGKQYSLKLFTHIHNDDNDKLHNHNIIYLMDQDIQWYLKRISAKERTDQSISGVMMYVLNTRIRLLAPFAPFISEEIWEIFGNRSIMFSNWPQIDQTKIDYTVDESEVLIMNLMADIQNIIKVTKIKPNKIFIYTAAEWKWNVYRKILNAIIEGKTNFGEIMKLLISDSNTNNVKQSPDMVKRIIEDILSERLDSRDRKIKLALINESKVFDDARSLLIKEFAGEITIYNEDDIEKIIPSYLF